MQTFTFALIYVFSLLCILNTINTQPSIPSSQEPKLITMCIFPAGVPRSEINCPYLLDSMAIESVDDEQLSVKVFTDVNGISSTKNIINNSTSSTRNISDYYISDSGYIIQEYDKPITMFQSSSILQEFNPPWGLDRIDQRSLPLDFVFNYNISVEPTIYIVDTGIRYTHSDFGNRVVKMVTCNSEAADFDGNGHGTHVAGIAAGYSYGVSKRAKLVSVKVLDSSGSSTMSVLVMALMWIINNGVPPYVVNLSLGGAGSPSVDSLVNRLSDMNGVVVVAAAGNSEGDACNQSPARAADAITVAASDISDSFASFSNFGTCVDIIAPGVNIQSASNLDDTSGRTLSGTSMSSPFVAGVASKILSTFPNIPGTEVVRMMTSISTTNVISGVPNNTPNELLYIFPTVPSPTNSPTTPPPTTRPPTTAPPTSVPPTNIPTTSIPPTPRPPTSIPPTSPAPTTVPPTTVPPTTRAPTSTPPTTRSPTSTSAPITISPTTRAPTSNPTTRSPTRQPIIPGQTLSPALRPDPFDPPPQVFPLPPMTKSPIFINPTQIPPTSTPPTTASK
jgi:hypothetical protein